MIRHGVAPFLECSSRGDKRFSAFYAKPLSLKGRTIEQAYQAMKVFKDGSSGLHWRQAKGRFAINQADCEAAYQRWWAEYIDENDYLLILRQATGLSDMFGQQGRMCQATVLWNIRNEIDK